MSLSSFSDSVFISSIVAKRLPFMGLFNLGNRKYNIYVVIHLFSTSCEELVPLVNTFLTYSTLTVYHFQHFKCFWVLNSIFYIKFDAYSLINFFRQKKIVNTCKTLLAFMPLTNKQKIVYCWNCEHTFGTSVPT